MDAWLLIGLLQPAFVAVVFAQRGRRKAQSLWLFAWLGVAFAHQLGIYLAFAHPSLLVPWLSIGFGLMPFLHGPMAFGYAASLLPPMRATQHLWAHLVPFFGFWIAYALIETGRWSGLAVDPGYGVSLLRDAASGAQIGWPAWMMAVSGGAYPLLGLYLLRRERGALRDSRSNIDAVQFRWLELWIFGHLVAFAAIFAIQLYVPLRLAMALTSWVLAAEVFYLGAFGIWQFERSANEGTARAPRPAPSPTLEADMARLLEHMKEAEPYRRTGLTLSDLSQSCGLAEETVTAAVKRAGYKHFFDFVNAHRCEAVRAKLIEIGDAPILELALETGFNSKSAFNRVFKARYGVSPSQYRAENGQSRAENGK